MGELPAVSSPIMVHFPAVDAYSIAEPSHRSAGIRSLLRDLWMGVLPAVDVAGSAPAKRLFGSSPSYLLEQPIKLRTTSNARSWLLLHPNTQSPSTPRSPQSRPSLAPHPIRFTNPQPPFFMENPLFPSHNAQPTPALDSPGFRSRYLPPGRP